MGPPELLQLTTKAMPRTQLLSISTTITTKCLKDDNVDSCMLSEVPLVKLPVVQLKVTLVNSIRVEEFSNANHTADENFKKSKSSLSLTRTSQILILSL